MTQVADDLLNSIPGRKSEVRQRLITERVVAEGSCTAQDLANEFGVSIMTIHRDLDVLQRRGIVRKFHGGVTAQPSGIFEARMSYRLMSNVNEKEQIGRRALEFVEPGMSVLLDDSTSILHMIGGFPERAPLHVATTFLTGLAKLAPVTEGSDITVIGIGGRYDALHDSFVGTQPIAQIESMRWDAVFMSTSSVSGEDAYHQEDHIMALKRVMLASAKHRYLLADHSKLGRVALHKIAPLTEFDCIITDEKADPEVLRAWRELGVRYEIASS
jgi:DeoR/GlpR family transcriptional regulator of sugar metabolism